MGKKYHYWTSPKFKVLSLQKALLRKNKKASHRERSIYKSCYTQRMSTVVS